MVVSVYDAELFGHWWYEGPEFLDFFVRKACSDQRDFTLVTPEEYLRRYPTHQVAAPAASSWGEEGYYRVWLNGENEWIYPHLHVAQERMTELARRWQDPASSALRTPAQPLASRCPQPHPRALKQAARELLLAQASDWPFILTTGTSPGYARQRVETHLLRFMRLYEQLSNGAVDEPWLAELEAKDNLFPDVDYSYWI